MGKDGTDLKTSCVLKLLEYNHQSACQVNLVKKWRNRNCIPAMEKR